MYPQVYDFKKGNFAVCNYSAYKVRKYPEAGDWNHHPTFAFLLLPRKQLNRFPVENTTTNITMGYENC